MRLKYLFLLVVFAVFLLFFINGAIRHTPPPGLELRVGENISPNVGVFVLNNDKKAVSAIDVRASFFFQQRGLPKGTPYGFRVIGENGEVVKPVYETFVAKASDWIESNRYYYGLEVGNYALELLTVNGGIGTIVARANFSVFDLELERAKLAKTTIDNCSYLFAEPVVDANGWSRDGKIAECIAKVAVGFKDTYGCTSSFLYFNLSAMSYDECIKDYAIITGDVSICDLTGMPKSRGFCKAKVTGDWAECRKVSCDVSCAMEGLETQKDLCIQWYAIEKRNASLCNEIKNTAYKDICLNLTTRR